MLQQSRDIQRAPIRMPIRLTIPALILTRFGGRARHARARRPAALQPHELCGRDRARHRGQGRHGHPRLVPHRSRPVPCRAAGRGAGRDPVRPRPGAAGLRRLAAAAGRPRRPLRRPGQLRAGRRAQLHGAQRPEAGAVHAGEAVRDRQGADRLSRRGGGVHRRPGARRRDPAAAQHRRLRRVADRRHPRRQDRRRPAAVHRRQQADRRPPPAVPTFSTC